MEYKKFFNRELSWLHFNDRVLALAKDKTIPILERVNFLNIFHSNMDEFFMKRVGGLKRQFLANVNSYSIDGLTPEEQLDAIRDRVSLTNKEITKTLNKDLLVELKNNNIELLEWSDLNTKEKKYFSEFFEQKVFPVLTPMAVDLGHPFPLISNLSMSLAVCLKHPGEEELLFARLKVPEIFPLWIKVKSNDENKHRESRFISLLDIIVHHLDKVFPKMEIQSLMSFKVTRNIDTKADDEGAEDLLELISEELKQRKFAEIVRLEHGPNPDLWLLDRLMDELELDANSIYELGFKLEYKKLDSITKLKIPQMMYKRWTPLTPPIFADEDKNIFNIIKDQDVLVHHPFESFATSVERFLIQAVDDPQVVAIKMTLYRTGEKSLIINQLIRAAEMGKQVVCVVELHARLDEERNIKWAQTLENAGVHVIYGVVGLKTHAKTILVVRQEKNEFLCYAHIGTGNYNSLTANLYTDLGLFTCNPDITRDIVELFHFLTGRSLKTDYNKILVAPVNMKSTLIEKIKKESAAAKKGKPSGIMAKMNQIEDTDVIEALYEASQNGVKIQLIIRGFSCLKAKVPGLSDNIEVISILGRFLEHSRIFYFRNEEKEEANGLFYIGSADWMFRNLVRRVEVLTPVDSPNLKHKLWDILKFNLEDNTNSWEMEPDGQYKRRTTAKKSSKLSMQEKLMELSVQQSLRGLESN